VELELGSEQRGSDSEAPGPADVVDDERETGPGIAQRLAGVEIPGRLGERFETLARVMAMLRSSDGCPWDLEQTPESLSRHLLEEAYETVEAIDSEDWANVAEEARRFDLGDVVDGITEKLERRHPHIFGEIKADTPEQVSANWERIKREQEGREPSMKVPPGLPAVMAAMKVQGHAAREGFDWDEVEGVLAKLEEEMDELEEVRAAGDAGETEHELGDILFTVVNLARHLRVDPEQALRRSTREFARRYEIMASEARRSGTDFAALSIDEKERLWQKAKLK
jgi:tetrapyrrole methylase family protein/MazG family protein